MNFKEQFPSLASRIPNEEYIPRTYLQVHCLDKQKTLNILKECKTIEEAIERLK